MIEKQMVTQLAIIDGVDCTNAEHNGSRWVQYDDEVGYIDIPDYLNDHNAIQRIIDNMFEDQLIAYTKLLGSWFNDRKSVDSVWDILLVSSLLQIPCKAKAEAILHVFGKWVN